MTTDTTNVRFTPSGGRTKYVVAMFYISIAVDIASVLSGFSQYSLLNSGSISSSAAETNDMIYGGIGALQSVIYLLTAIGFLIWFHRSHKNLPSLGAEGLEYSPGWAVGGFFVPFLNLVRPYQVAKEISKASQPSATASNASEEWKQAKTPSIVKTWWTFFLLANFSAYIGMRVMFQAHSIDSLQGATAIMIASDVLSILGAYFAIKLVNLIDEYQSSSHAAISRKFS